MHRNENSWLKPNKMKHWAEGWRPNMFFSFSCILPIFSPLHELNSQNVLFCLAFQRKKNENIFCWKSTTCHWGLFVCVGVLPWEAGSVDFFTSLCAGLCFGEVFSACGVSLWCCRSVGTAGPSAGQQLCLFRPCDGWRGERLAVRPSLCWQQARRTTQCFTPHKHIKVCANTPEEREQE